MNTSAQFDDIINACKIIFLHKTADYGTSWRVYRTISVADQIYIKAKRIRNIQSGIVQKIADDVQSEWMGILNYCIIGLIQLQINNDQPEELAIEVVEHLYTQQIQIAKELMQHKNNDYGEAWRDMHEESFVDLSLAKILRIKQIVANNGITQVSEGVASNFLDILNYAAFSLILIEENKLS